MGTRKRIISLEEKTHSKKQYLAVVWPANDWNTDPRGIKVQPPAGEEDFFLKDEKALEAFGDKPGIELTIINVVYETAKQEPK